jgi:hypothetical protein
VQSPSWEADNRSAGQEIPGVLWNPNVQESLILILYPGPAESSPHPHTIYSSTSIHINASVCFRSSSVATSSRERPWRRHLTAVLRLLLTEDTREANNYREHIEGYNSAVAFASMGAEIISPSGNGRYCFRKQPDLPFSLTVIDKRGK